MKTTLLTFIALLFTCAALAEPRPSLPPFPELQLGQWAFDATNRLSLYGDDIAAARNIQWAESWSGYALQMSGSKARSLLIAAISESGGTNVAPFAGTIRFWFRPYWVSGQSGGKGPGGWARLFEMGRITRDDEEQALALVNDPLGNKLLFVADGRKGGVTYLEAPVQWTSNSWHEIAVSYWPQGCALAIDGETIARSEMAVRAPAIRYWPQVYLALGGGLDGRNLAQGELDELTTFAFPVNPEYLQWRHRQLAPIARLGPVSEEEIAWRREQRRRQASGEEMMATSEAAPAPPGDGGGSGGDGMPWGGTTGPGLKLTAPFIAGATLSTTLAEADANSAYEVFQRTVLQTSAPWLRVASGEVGQTNFVISLPPTNTAFYVAAQILDSDFDGLSDAFEEKVLLTPPLNADRNGNGIPDGNEDANGNGLPDRIDYSGLTRAILHASRPLAYEGGVSGEITLRLPTPAPTGAKVTLHLGGTADHEGDYRLLKLDGTPVTNDLVLPAGTLEVRLQVQVIDDAVQSSQPRKVSIALVSSPNYLIDPERAEVTLVDNDLPIVSIIASDAKATEPGTNIDRGRFTVRREGSTLAPLTVQLNVSGSAANGVDYAALGSSVILPTGSNTVALVLDPLHDTAYEGSETATLSLAANAAYTIHPLRSSATVTIADDDLPVVSLIGTDLIATEYGPTSAQVTIRRTGNTAQPLTVPMAIGGTATDGVDYQTLSETVTFAANAVDATINIQAINNPEEEQAETIILTIKGSASYTIGASNSVTVFVDDSSPTRYQTVSIKSASVYSPGSIDSPAVFDIQRFGRSDQAANLPFQIYTNALGGPQLTTFYRVYGDVSGNNAVLASFAPKARLNFTAPQGGASGGGAINLLISSISQDYWPIWLQPSWQYVRFEVVDTNAFEGLGAQGRVRLFRPVAGPAVSVDIAVSGNATASGLPQPDHSLPASFTMTLPQNVTSVDTTFSALADGALEGWETVIFTPNVAAIQTSLEVRSPFMAFLRDNVVNLAGLPETDTDRDGLPDRWEIANGFDSFTAGEQALDADKDGLTNLEEYSAGTNPRLADSDNNGIPDFQQVNQVIDPGADYVAIKLRTRDTGKVNNGNNCAVCHTTQLKVGDYSHFSPIRDLASEKSFYFRKGSNYSIYLSELVRNLPPTGNVSGNPTTTETYSAEILPAGAAPAAFVLNDPQGKLGVNKPWSTFPADPTVAIGTLTVPRIEVIWTHIPGNLALDTNSSWGGGLRVFPDQLSPTDGAARNTVRILVKTTPPLPGKVIRLRSFDVDDPTNADVDWNNVIDTDNGGIGEQGGDNRGFPVGGALAQAVLTLNGQGEATTDFTVALQPGDNYRVAAVLDAPGAENHLASLQLSSPEAPLYVPSGQAAIPGFAGALSPMLTVWRKLHLEFDSMTALPPSGPEAIYVNATISSIKPNYPSNGKSQLVVRHTRTGFERNLFESGKIEIPNAGTYAVTVSSTRSIQQDALSTIEIAGVPGGNLIGVVGKLYDDDDQYLANDPLYPSILGLQSPPLPANERSIEFISAMQPRFNETYILLVSANTNGWNSQATIPFQRNAGPGLQFFNSIRSDFDVGNLQLKGTDRPAFWAFSVAFGYQPADHEDGDPDTETPLTGGTPKKGIPHSSHGSA